MGEHAAHGDEEVIPMLRVADARRTVAWYEQPGFTREAEHRFGPGMPAFVTVARRSVRLFLSEHTGDARPDTLIYLRVRDVDALAAALGARGRGAGSRPESPAHRHTTTVILVGEQADGRDPTCGVGWRRA